MTDHEQALRHALSAVPDPEASPGYGNAVAERARRTRRQRRTALGSALAVGVLVVGVSVTTAGSSQPARDDRGGAADRSETPATPPFPAPPEGTKWVGRGRVVVAVPTAWPVAADYCDSTAAEVVLVDASAADTSCYVSSGRTARVAFEEYVDSPTSLEPACELSDPGRCFGRRELAEQGVTVKVLLAGGGSSAEVAWILDSAMVLPDGWTTVPAGGEDRASRRVALLEEAGFEVDDSELEVLSGIEGAEDGPIRSVPEPGSPVRVGSTIALFPEGYPKSASDLAVTFRQRWPDPQTSQPEGTARWNAERQSVVYVLTQTFDGCPVTGEASVTSGAVSLEVRPTLEGVVCDSRFYPPIAAISGLSEAPTELTVTEDGETRTVPVEQPREEAPGLDVAVDVVPGWGIRREPVRWDPKTRELSYVTRTFNGRCDVEGSVSGSGSAPRMVLSARPTPGVACASIATVVVAVVSGFTEAPAELTVTEDGRTTTLPVVVPQGS